MRRAGLDEEIAAVVTLCRRLGLGDVAPALLKAAHHASLLLPSIGLVARVQSSEPLDRAHRTAERELAVTRHLATQGAPVLAPIEGKLAGPHVMPDAVVTLWPYLDGARAADQADAVLAATTLAAVHRAFQSYAGRLPPYIRTLDRCWSVLADDRACAALSADDRALLKAQFRRLRDEVASANARWVPLHGDAHSGNLMLGGHGAAWTDFEDACLGPPELDIANLPRAAWARFEQADQRLVEQFADLKSVCVAVWCSADPMRSVEVREAADYHLTRVRRRAS